MLLSGAGLRLYQYFANRSLFIDEAALALNVRERSFAQLLAPLDHAQTAPIGFLWLEKAIMLVLGQSEYALRMPALLAGLLSLPLFLALARRVLPAHLLGAAMATFAFGEYLIYWSSDAKPYALDVVAGLMLLLLSMRFAEQPTRRRGAALGVAGAAAPYFAHASVLVLAGIAVWLAGHIVRTRRIRSAAVALPWLLAVPAVIHAATSLTLDGTRYFDWFWRDGFLPLPLSWSALSTYRVRLLYFLYDPLGFRFGVPVYVGLLTTGAGAAWLVLRRRHTALLLAPALVVLAASFASIYPVGARWSYSGRVVLFLAPIAYLAATACFAWIRHRTPAIVLAAVLPVVIAIPAITSLPYTRGEARGALAHVSRHARDGDLVYVHYGIRQAIDYYRPRIQGTVVAGRCAQADRAAYLADLERLRGNRRVWIVMAYDLYDERGLFVEYMRRNAVLLDSTSLRLADARLYDFTPPGRGDVPRELLAPIVRPDVGTDCTGIFAAP
jgi:hypothetical protein